LTVARNAAPETLPAALAWLQPRSLLLEAPLVPGAVPRLVAALPALESLEMCFQSQVLKPLERHVAPVLTHLAVTQCDARMFLSPQYRIGGFRCDALRSLRLGLPGSGSRFQSWMAPLLLETVGCCHTGLRDLAIDANVSQKHVGRLLDRLTALESLELRSVTLAAVTEAAGETPYDRVRELAATAARIEKRCPQLPLARVRCERLTCELLEVLDVCGVQLRCLVVAGRATKRPVVSVQASARGDPPFWPLPRQADDDDARPQTGDATVSWATVVAMPEVATEPPAAWTPELLTALAGTRTLTHLHVSRVPFTDTDLGDLLAALPELATVCLADTQVTRQFCAATVASGRVTDFSIDGPPPPDIAFPRPPPPPPPPPPAVGT
jgi:hypothetical protein